MVVERRPLAGVETAVEQRGDGPAILALHALELGGSRSEWQPLADRLVAAGYRVILPDWPGCGETGPLTSYTPELLGDWLAALLDANPGARHWLARGQAAAYAIAAGERCDSLTVIGPDGLHPEPARDELYEQLTGPAGRRMYADLTDELAVRAWLQDVYATDEQVTEDEVAAIVRQAGQPGAERFFAAWASGRLRLDVRLEWINLTQPLLLVWGELAEDPPLERVDDWIMPLRPDAPVMMIQGRPIGIWKQNVTYKSFRTGARPHLERPVAVAKVIVEHLANAAGAGP